MSILQMAAYSWCLIFLGIAATTGIKDFHDIATFMLIPLLFDEVFRIIIGYRPE